MGVSRCWVIHCQDVIVGVSEGPRTPKTYARDCLCLAHFTDWERCKMRMTFSEFIQNMYIPVIWERMHEWMET